MLDEIAGYQHLDVALDGALKCRERNEDATSAEKPLSTETERRVELIAFEDVASIDLISYII